LDIDKFAVFDQYLAVSQKWYKTCA